MLTYILRRVMISIVVLIGIATLAFLSIHLVPGDPAKIELGQRATPQAVARLHHEMGLDKPLGEQYVEFLKNAATLNFGRSFTFKAPTTETVINRLAPTAILIVYGLLITLVVGVPLAIVAAVRQGGVVDNSIRLVTTF